MDNENVFFEIITLYLLQYNLFAGATDQHYTFDVYWIDADSILT